MSDIDGLKKFWEELKERNVVKAVVFYIGASFAILQALDLVLDRLGLSDSIFLIVLISLAIGLPIVAVVAWIFELTADGLKKTDSVPKGKFTKRTGKILNNAITIVLAIAVIFLVVANYVVTDDDELNFLENDALAIYPIIIEGNYKEYSGSTIQNFISEQLGTIPEINVIDTDLLKVELKDEDEEINPELAAEVSGKLGVSRSVIGRLSAIGSNLTFSLKLYDANGFPIGEPINENGSNDDAIRLMLKAANRLAQVELERMGKETTSLAISSAAQPFAVAPYIESTTAMREGNYDLALEKIRESIEKDSTFTMAYAKYLEIAGWLQLGLDQEIRQAEYLPNLYRLEELSEDMKSSKLGEIVRAKILFEKSDISAEREFRRLLGKYGDDTEILMGLSESIFHLAELQAEDITEAKTYLRRLLRIDSTNKEVLLHLIDIAVMEEKVDSAEYYISQLRESKVEAEIDQDYNRQLYLLNLKDNVSDQELMEIANQIDIDDFEFRIKPAMRQVQGLELVKRMFELDEILEDQYSAFYGRAKFSTTGGHEMLSDDVFEEILEYDGIASSDAYTLLLDDGHPDVRFFEGKEIPIIQLFEDQMISTEMPIGYYLLYTYLQAKMYLSIGDLKSFNLKENDLLASFNDDSESAFGPTGEVARLFYYNLKTHQSYLDEEYEISLIYADSAIKDVLDIEISVALNFSKTRNLFRAESYRKLGDLKSAKNIYKNLAESRYPSGQKYGSPTYGATWGYLVYRLAQMHDQLNEKDQAIKYYRIFINAYLESDDKYQDWVDDSYKRLAELSGTPEQELRSNSEILD